jgi:hypothetical protein
MQPNISGKIQHVSSPHVHCLCQLLCVYSCEDQDIKDTTGLQSPSPPSSIELYLSVKTSASQGNHARRPLSLLRSWANTRTVREHTFFFTDAAEHDPVLLAMSGTRRELALQFSATDN